MAKSEVMAQEVGAQAGLKVRAGFAFGRYKDFLVSIHGGTAGFMLLVAFPKEADGPAILENLDIKTLLKSVKSIGQATVENGVLRVGFNPSFRMPEAAKVKAFVDSVVDAVRAHATPFGPNCENCGGSPADVVLVNWSPVLSCDECLEKLRRQVQEAAGALEATTPDYKRGLAYGMAAVIGSAFVYGLISGLSRMFFFFAGILMGLAVGYALAYGARKITAEVIGLAILLTVFAIFLGEVFYVAISLLAMGAPLSWLPQAFIDYLAFAPNEFLVALLMGLLGAGYVAYRLHAEGRTQKPTLEITT